MKVFKLLTLIIFYLIIFAIQPALSNNKIVEERGGKKVKAVKYENSDWKLIVDGKPYFIKGVVFNPVLIGESPGESTMRDWMYYDENNNGKNDVAYDVWVDKNKNDVQDKDEIAIGDFQILKDMGCNTIRLYHVPSDNPILGDIYRKNPSVQLQYDHPVNKELLRSLYKDYGILVIMGNFMGSWTIGSGTTWDEGCDYTNPLHKENIKKSVQAMVEDNKDEPYVLMWLLGNENNIATWSKCNAREHPKEYLQFVNEIAKMVHQMDPDHPVAICEGFMSTDLKLYKDYIPEIDIVAYNAYMGEYGFGFLWKETKREFDRPVFISEYGLFAYNTKDGETEEQQLKYHKGCFNDIMSNKAGGNPSLPKKCVGNSIGGCIFDYIDRWYMDGRPLEHNAGEKYWSFSPDHRDHEEYFGITSMGDGKHNIFKRQLRSSYYFYKEKWANQ